MDCIDKSLYYSVLINQSSVQLSKCLFKYIFLELQEITLVLNSLEGDKVAQENLEDFLENLGITLFKDEVEKIRQSDIVSGEHLRYSQCL